jgi:DNA-binding response OmpR family regulator
MKKGYGVISAANGLEAIEIIGDTQRQLDLVLLDLNMPGADGLQVLKVIRACRPSTKVLVISGHITSDMRSKFKALGQDDWLQKPYALDDIGRRLRVLLDSAPRVAA